jgi:hypothetical protein
MSKKKTNIDSNGLDNDSILKEMGINNPTQISRYSLREENGEDVLRIYYKRAKGSLLPTSRKYSFGRSQKTIITDSGGPEYAPDPQISNVLQRVLKALDGIARNANDRDVAKAAIIDDIDHMDRYLSTRIRELRARVEQL